MKGCASETAKRLRERNNSAVNREIAFFIVITSRP